MAEDIIVDLEEETIEVSIEETTITVEVLNGAGPQGPPGEAGQAANVYSHNQTNASQDWVVNHNLNKYVNVAVIVDDEEVDADVIYNSLNQVTIHFASPQVGRVEVV
jgi:hypothetical protein